MSDRKNLLLLYYTGTYNTKYLTMELKKKFTPFYNVETYEVNIYSLHILELSKFDIIGLGYPIYSFNVPSYFIKFLKKQRFPKDIKYFIYKNSGETYNLNSASSSAIIRLLKKQNVKVTNEYHFPMPYNIIFRFPNEIVSELLNYNDKLMDILVHDINQDVKNIKRYKLFYKIFSVLLRIQCLGGPVNSFFYRVDKNCIKCDKCLNNCPTENIYKKDGKIRFHHHCIMCMRCSFCCPTSSIKIGFLNHWKVNKPYDLYSLKEQINGKPSINKDTKGFFKCYIKTFKDIDTRFNQIKGK